MKKIKWHLLLIAAFGICAGYVNKPQKFLTAKGQEMDTYAFWYTTDGRYYYGYDLTSNGWVQGIDYDCTYPGKHLYLHRRPHPFPLRCHGQLLLCL